MSHFQSLWHRSPAFKTMLILAAGLSILLVSLALEPKRAPAPPQPPTALAKSQFSAPATQVAEPEIETGGTTGASAAATTEGKKVTGDVETTPASGAAPVEKKKHDATVIAAPQKIPDSPVGSAQPATGNNAAKSFAPVPANPSITPPAGAEAAKILMGKTLSGQLSVQERSVPLPAGDWIVVAHFPASAPGSVESLFLAQPGNNKLAGAVLIQVMRQAGPQMTGFRQSSQCMRSNLLYLKVMSNEDFGSQDCWSINHNHSGEWKNPKGPGILQAAAGELEVRGVALPPVMLSVYFRLADKQSFLNAVYYFNPETEGITSSPTPVWDESDWFQQYIRKYPEKVAYFQRLRDWSQGWHVRVRDAFGQELKPQGSQSPAVPK